VRTATASRKRGGALGVVVNMFHDLLVQLVRSSSTHARRANVKTAA
jgi:hypothetical protein